MISQCGKMKRYFHENLDNDMGTYVRVNFRNLHTVDLRPTMWKNEKFSPTKKYFVKSTLLLYSNLFSKILPKIRENEFP